MTRQLFTLALGFGLLVLCATHAYSQTQRKCGPRDRILGVLAERYGETRRSVGLGNGNQVLEMFASTETGSWTVIVTSPSGLTCLLASGQSYEEVAEELGPKGTSL